MRTVSIVSTAALALLGLASAGCGDEPRTPQAKVPARGEGPQPIGGVRTRDLDSFGRDQVEPLEIAPGIHQAHGVGNAVAVETSEGRVIIDTGLPTQSAELRKRLDRASDAPIRKLILTHAHADHYGGWKDFVDDDTEIVAHRIFLDNQRYLKDLAPYFMRRNHVFYPESTPDPDRLIGRALLLLYPTVQPTRVLDGDWSFELGGQRFEVLHTPGAEGEDGISVWLPDRRILFTGDFFGPLFPMWPNLYTIRGEKLRFPHWYLASLDRLIALEPEVIVPSHFLPIEGRERILEGMIRTRDAVRYVHDRVVEGMNDGKTVFELMRDVKLPPELDLSEAHGKVSWSVRGIWEGYSGWFHFRSTTELYDVPREAVDPELVAMAGGPDAVAAAAAAHVEAGQPLEALHLVDATLAARPGHRAALRARLAALLELLERSGDENHSEVLWLQARIRKTREALGE